MQTIKVQTRVGGDGVLKLEVPLNLRDIELEVLIVVQPLDSEKTNRAEWLAFIEETAGSLADNPIERQ